MPSEVETYIREQTAGPCMQGHVCMFNCNSMSYLWTKPSRYGFKVRLILTWSEGRSHCELEDDLVHCCAKGVILQRVWFC